MRKLVPLLAACAMLCATAAALGERLFADGSEVNHYYHRAADCAVGWNVEPSDEADISPRKLHPCPACVPDEAAYDGVTALQRGGTLVLVIPDAYMAEQLASGAAPARVPDELLHAGDRQEGDIARLVHGKAYLDYLDGARVGGVTPAAACVPDVSSNGAILMSRRHIGAAWYLVVRPNADARMRMADGGEITLNARFYRANLEISTWPAGATLSETEGSECWTGALTVRPEPSAGEIVYRNADDADGAALYVVRDGGVNTCVIRKRDGGAAPTRWLKYCGALTALAGYADGKDAVYCCALTDGELASLRDKLYFDINHIPAAMGDGAAADAGASDPGHAPVTRAALSDGSIAEMDAAEYPVGTAFVSYALIRPEGGIAGYEAYANVEKLTDGLWKGVGSARARANGDEKRAHAGHFCDAVRLVVPLDDVGALEEGLYRLQVGEWETQVQLEFRVKTGAAQPSLPETAGTAGAGLAVAAHTPPHVDALHYNSCQDTTRRVYGSTHSRLLAGDTVFELWGIDESWGWGIGSHYDLFAYPEGHPERARQLAADIDHADLTLYDAGDGLLLWSDGEEKMYRCGYDGANLRRLEGLSAGEDEHVRAILPVGDGLYIAKDGGIWYTPLDDIAPEPVYRAERGIQNSDGGGGFMVYAGGKLLVADGGIVAIDTTRRGADGRMPAVRLTETYDTGDGDCGFGYIALNGRLYCWSAEAAATVSMALDGGDRRVVSREHYWFSQVDEGGVVLALSGTTKGFFGDDRTGAAFYLPDAPDNPIFDPDHCRARPVGESDYDYIMGSYLYHTDGDGSETRLPVGETMQ